MGTKRLSEVIDYKTHIEPYRMGNNPMVGASVAVSVATSEASK